MKTFKGTKGEWIAIERGRYFIAVTASDKFDTSDTNYIDKEQAKANAKLKAAAPDLLEAIQDVLLVFEERETAIPVSTQMKIEKAISKALD